MCWAYEQRVGDPAAKFVLIMLADCAEGTEFSWPLASVPKLSARTELPPEKLQRAMDILLARGFIRRERVYDLDGYVEGVVLAVLPSAIAEAS